MLLWKNWCCKREANQIGDVTSKNYVFVKHLCFELEREQDQLILSDTFLSLVF